MGILEFMGEHPWLTFMLALLFCITVESVAAIVTGRKSVIAENIKKLGE